MTWWCWTLLAIWVVSLVVIFLLALTAGEGYEDKDGFHDGSKS